MATKERMTVHKALAELKVLGDRVDKAIKEGVFCTEIFNYSKTISGMSIENYKDKVIKASYDKTEDLLKRYVALKNAVNESNAKTDIDINGTKMTIAVAIWMKNQGMDYKEKYLDKLKVQYGLSKKKIDLHNDALCNKADDYVIKKYGQKDGKIENTDISKERKEYIEENTMKLIDPMHILEKIEALEKEIFEFNAEIDAAISVSNALTEIEISY